MAVRRKKVAVIHCNGRPTRKEGFEQVTVTGNCQEILTQYPEGINICSYGCLGGGSCVEACRLHAVSIGERGIAKIDDEKCVGCGLCAKACPQHLIQVVPTENTIQPQCANLDKGPKAIQGCAVSCIGCRICEKYCPCKAIKVVDNHAVICQEKCIACGMCAVKCPRGVIHDKNGILSIR